MRAHRRDLRDGAIGFEACCDDRDAERIAHGVVDIRAEDDVCLGIGILRDDLGSLIDFEQAEIRTAGDVHEDAARAVDAGFEQRALDSLTRCLRCTLFAGGVSDAHVREAFFLHDGLDIRKVKVDHGGNRDEVGNALDALAEHVVCNAERIRQARTADEVDQLVIRDRDEGVHDGLERCDADLGVAHTHLTFKCEGLCHDADGQYAEFLGALCDDGSGARAGAAAHTGGDERHVRVGQHLHDLLAALLGSLAADFRIRACAEAARQLLADLDLCLSLAEVQRLLVGVDRNELYAAQTVLYHAIDRIAARSADADHLDLGECCVFVYLFKHRSSPLLYK
ncbi:putative uncharacterized protein [Clostridium sp. CAG:1024]|nr:putative uncharacterized protein [Clostridium sp. CAG:1024]